MRRSISIIIPAFNEELRLPATLKKVREYLSRSAWDFHEIVVVDDGSSDATADTAARAGARVLRNPGNRGKGYTVRHGVLEASGDWVLFTDADLSAPIEELDKLWAAVEGGRSQAAIGSRALDRSLIGVHQSAFREWSGRFFNLVMRLLTGLPYADTQCGFKLFHAAAAREVFSRQRLEGLGFDVEILFIARKLGYKVAEVPVRWDDVAGTKVNLWRGLTAFLDPLKVRWNAIRGRYK